ncbi:TPA: hypothetical protein ENS27_06450 [bacterium]|nr:hypothetical protein [bacterium]
MPKQNVCITKVMTPSKSVRAYCLDCCCGSAYEVKLCPAGDCPIHPYRLGNRPSNCVPLSVKTIRARCIDCSGGSEKDVAECWNTECALYPFRMGKNPNRTGIGGNLKSLQKYKDEFISNSETDPEADEDIYELIAQDSKA